MLNVGNKKMATKCFFCRRPYVDPQLENEHSAFTLTAKDLGALQEIKNKAFAAPRRERKACAGFLNQVVSNRPGMELADAFSSQTEVCKDSPTFFRGLVGLLWAGEDELWKTWRHHSVMWRTMTDRSANMRDIMWLLQTAYVNDVGMNAMFLHKNSFMWVVIRRPPYIVDSNARVIRARVLDGIVAGLSGMPLRRNKLEEINSALYGLGKVVVYKYSALNSRSYGLKFYATGTTMAFLMLVYVYRTLHNVVMSTWLARRLWSEALETDVDNAFSGQSFSADVESERIVTTATEVASTPSAESAEVLDQIPEADVYIDDVNTGGEALAQALAQELGSGVALKMGAGGRPLLPSEMKPPPEGGYEIKRISVETVPKHVEFVHPNRMQSVASPLLAHN